MIFPRIIDLSREIAGRRFRDPPVVVPEADRWRRGGRSSRLQNSNTTDARCFTAEIRSTMRLYAIGRIAGLLLVGLSVGAVAEAAQQ